jgi:hypothetical protein
MSEAYSVYNTRQPEPVPTEQSEDVGQIIQFGFAGVIESDWPDRAEIELLFQERDRFGMAKYSVPLMTHDGREPIIDALQEAMDLTKYLCKATRHHNGSNERLRRLNITALGIVRELYAYAVLELGMPPIGGTDPEMPR